MNKYKYCIDCKNESDESAQACEHCGSVNFETNEAESDDEPDIWHYEKESQK